MGKQPRKKGTRCIVDDTCKWKCRSRKEHDIREEGKRPIVFGKRKPERDTTNPVLNERQGKFLKEFCD